MEIPSHLIDSKVIYAKAKLINKGAEPTTVIRI